MGDVQCADLCVVYTSLISVAKRQDVRIKITSTKYFFTLGKFQLRIKSTLGVLYGSATLNYTVVGKFATLQLTIIIFILSTIISGTAPKTVMVQQSVIKSALPPKSQFVC